MLFDVIPWQSENGIGIPDFKAQKDRKKDQLPRKKWVDQIKSLFDAEVRLYLSQWIPNGITEYKVLSRLREFKTYLAKECAALGSNKDQHADSLVVPMFKKPSQLIIGNIQINKVRFINKFLESTNENLEEGGYIFGFFEPAAQRKERIFQIYNSLIRRLVWFFDFLFHQSMPKFRFLRKFYFNLTKGKCRVLSEIEMYGRLYSCGFELVSTFRRPEKMYFIGRKIGLPAYNENASFGPIVNLSRTGKGGEEIKVFKLRTMYPYAEYLQKQIYESHGLREGGKFRGDVRVTPEGKLARRYFLDELPMLINLFKGDIKLVGVRPLSSHYFSLYPVEFREYRSRFKPGLFPPFYADLPNGLDEIIKSEESYLQQYERQPIRTDIRYMMRGFYNILFKKARSN